MYLINDGWLMISWGMKNYPLSIYKPSILTIVLYNKGILRTRWIQNGDKVVNSHPRLPSPSEQCDQQTPVVVDE